MKIYPILIFFSTTLFLFLSSSTAINTLSTNQPLKDDGNTLVSDGETYELGFFSPGKSKNRYLGIWYKKITTLTVVWVANRNTPINDTSGVFQVSTEGTLQILSGTNTIIWSSSYSTSQSTSNKPVAQLLDTGNLVVRDETNTIKNPIWQSFDYPGDTLLPGQKLGKNLVTGKETNLTSWKSTDDPSMGRYKVFVNTNGYPQLLEEEGEVPRSRIGPWNGEGFRGLPRENTNPVYSVEWIVNQNEIYYTYKLKSLVFQRIVLTWDGNHIQYSWINRSHDWGLYGNIVVDNCSQYGRCGPYGICSTRTYPPCNCMKGFEPKVLEEWNSGDWSSGCQRKKGLSCGSSNEDDGFQKISGVKFPDTQRSWYNESMSLKVCEMTCKGNCSCIAYANLDIRNGGTGCLLWFDGLMDIREYDDNQGLYIRMAISELAEIKGQSNFKRKKLIILVVVLSVSSIALLLSAVGYVYRKKKGQGYWTHKDHTSADQVENLDELPFFSLNKIAKATNNFHSDNKIGEGGFGPVYKGVLKDGQVIAVKRLSETSQQGPDEFKNEVICIAKLQHRNLVKLLGYCIDGNEKILIYEYMDNISLDSFLFDETRSSMLDWPQRFHIILGMARGILYLHQDSRLQIIHRDLKAANILLDREMNPKISDFGLARKFVGLDAMAKTKNVVGTYGYISPEYAVHGHISVKSDVFSFGVIVLEIVSGKKNRGFTHEGHSDNLLGHAWRLYKEDNSVELIDASLRNSCVFSQALRSVHVGLLCVQQNAEDRPTMSSVVSMLTTEGTLPPPKQPAFFTEESYRELECHSSPNEYMITVLCAR